jgi:hypothetical protein
VLTVLDHTGHDTLTWDHDDEAGREKARQLVADLKKAGYAFFEVSGEPADEVSAGKGTLVVRKLTAEEVIALPQEEIPIVAEPPAEQPKRRGRPRKDASAPPKREVVATRPIRGG